MKLTLKINFLKIRLLIFTTEQKSPVFLKPVEKCTHQIYEGCGYVYRHLSFYGSVTLAPGYLP